MFVGFRVHHCMADGLSVLKLLVERLGGKRLVRQQGRIGGSGWSREALWTIGRHYFSWARSLFGGKRERFWVGEPESRCVVGIGELIEFAGVKETCRRVGVCGSSIVISGVLGGLAKFLKDGDKRLDATEMRVGYVLPLSGHPDRLCNHWRTTYLKFRMDEAAAPVSAQFLRRFDEIFVGTKNGSLAFFFLHSIKLGAYMCGWIGELMLRNRIVGVGITNIAGEDEGFSVCGSPCVGYTLSARGIHGVGIMFCIQTYKQGFRVVCVADENVFGSSQVQSLVDCVEAEFREIFVTKNDGVGSEALECELC